MIAERPALRVSERCADRTDIDAGSPAIGEDLVEIGDREWESVPERRVDGETAAIAGSLAAGLNPFQPTGNGLGIGMTDGKSTQFRSSND